MYLYNDTRELCHDVSLSVFQCFWEKLLFKSFLAEAVVQRCSAIDALLKISQNSQENKKTLCQSLFFQASGLQLLKKRPWYRCFPVNFARCLRTPFLQNTGDGYFFSEVLLEEFIKKFCAFISLLSVLNFFCKVH